MNTKGEREGTMKPQPVDYFVDMEEQGGSTVAMDVDDVEALEMFGEGPISMELHRLADSDFFNSFQDDFDDSDIN
ncbi:small acidic 1 [Olea europaea subsp. europaea]|uniref:Small acidic 1 n=2 Tax=Olea europaea subsp. europaea TaxID=158383 RepID=A0A8S0PDE5_OLEEU|nr:small acidic 1 [Olea europaea subsp. europaea]